MIGLKVPGKTVLNDAVTGLVMAVINVPQALANGVLAGVNPVFGLYSMIVGTTVAAFVTASVFMNVDSTSATALTAGEAGIESPFPIQNVNLRLTSKDLEGPKGST